MDTEVRSEPTESVVATIQSGGYGTKEIGILQHADNDIRQIVLVLQGFTKDSSPQWNSKFTLHKGVLYKKHPGSGRSLLLVVPSIMRRDIVEECHDSADGGHRGVEKTLARIRQRFWWKGVASSVKSYVKSFHFCQTFKSLVGLPVGKLQPISPPREMFHTLGIDHLGPFKPTIRGNRHLIVCIDYLSRWMEARPMASTGVVEVLPFLEEALILHHGTPTRIISGKGPCFTSFAFSAYCDKWNIKHVPASAEHPETAVISPESAFPWPPSTPLTHEERVEVVSRWRKIARRLIIIRQKKSKLNYDRFRKADPTFQIVELVLIAQRRKINKNHEEIHPAILWPVPSLPQSITYMLCSRRFTMFPTKTTLAPFQCTRQSNQAIFCTT